MQHAPHVAWQWVGDTIVAIDLKTNTAVGLNGTGAHVWALLGQSTPRDIAASLAEKYAIPQERAFDDVMSFLTGLVERGLVEKEP